MGQSNKIRNEISEIIIIKKDNAVTISTKNKIIHIDMEDAWAEYTNVVYSG